MTLERPLRVAVAADGPPLPLHRQAADDTALERVLAPDAERAIQTLIEGRADLAWLAVEAAWNARTPVPVLLPVAAPPDHPMHTWNLFGLRGGPVATSHDLPGHRVALPSDARSGVALALLGQAEPFPEQAFTIVRTRGPDAERDVLRCLLGGTAEAGLVDAAFWRDMTARTEVPKGAFDLVWSSPALPTAAIFARADTPDMVTPMVERLAAGTGTSWVPLAGHARSVFAAPPHSRPAPEATV